MSDHDHGEGCEHHHKPWEPHTRRVHHTLIAALAIAVVILAALVMCSPPAPCSVALPGPLPPVVIVVRPPVPPVVVTPPPAVAPVAHPVVHHAPRRVVHHVIRRVVHHRHHHHCHD